MGAIALTNDHAGFEMRQALIPHLQARGLEVLTFGADSSDSVDYPDVVQPAVETVLDGRARFAILICGTGIGISISANKHDGIRCALCTDELGAEMARAHNDANALALRGRQIDPEINKRIVDKFLDTPFEGGRHQRRVDKIMRIEQHTS